MSNVEAGQFQNFVELLQYRAKHQADDIAFRFLPDGDITPLAPTLTFAELDHKARSVAQELLNTCVRGDRALLIYPSGLDFITAFFGCLYAGVIAVPAYPPKRNQKLKRLQALIEDCDAKMALTDARSYDIAFPQFSAVQALEHISWLCTDTEVPLAEFDFKVQLPNDDDIAFLQYTSGSTGDPKGVMVSQANLIINSELIYTATSHNDDDVVVGWMPLFHDMGLIGNVLQPVFASVPCTFMQPTAFLRKPLRWLKAISEYKGTSSGGPNFAYDICVSTIKDAELEHLDLSSWKVAFNGAEPIRVNSMRAFSEKFSSCGFKDEAHYPCYGMAETVLHMTSNDVSRADYSDFFDAELLLKNIVERMESSDPGAIELVNCGRTWCDHIVEIVNPETLQACKEAQIGEIWAQGGTITKGYWKKPEVTEEIFNAYISEPKKGPFLRTGDLGFLLNGELFVTGRLKDVLIIRGLNHYPQDVELTVFECHESLMPNGAVAFAVQQGGDEQLVLVLEVKRTFLRKFDANEVAMEIQKSIAEQHDLQANSILFIKPGRLSKTSSGKVQRQRSKQLFLADEIDAITRIDKKEVLIEGDAPDFPSVLWQEAVRKKCEDTKKTIIVQYLLEVFSAYAGISTSEFQSDKAFVAYGLDSLALSRITAKLAEDLDIDLSIDTLFIYETIKSLTEALITLTHTENQARRPISVISQQDNKYSLSHAQQRMWFLSQFEQSTLYHISGFLDLSGDLDTNLLDKSFQKIIGRHESLRTRFVESDGQVVQIVDASVDWQLSILDLSDGGVSELNAAIESEMQIVFDLSKDVLFRATLYKKSDGEYTLSVSMHHIIADGWSVAVLLNELSTIYAALVDHREVPLAPITIHYKDYSAWQQKYVEENLVQKQSEYWSRQLKDCQALDLLTDKPRPSRPDYSGDRVSFDVGEKLCRQLKNLSQTQGATLYMTLLTAFNILLSKYSGQTDICVGSPIAGRTRSEAQNLIGLFVNTLVMRTDLSEDTSFVELLNNVKTTTIKAYANQDVPFEKVVDAVQPDRDVSITPLFQTMFVLQDEQTLSADFPGLETTEVQQHSNVSQFDITLEMVGYKDSIKGNFEFKTSLFKRSTIEQLTRHFLNLLSSIVECPDSRVSRLCLLDEADIRQQIVEWNDTGVSHPEDQCIHELFERRVQTHPDAIALVFEGQHLTYKDLNCRANQLAHYLINEKHIVPDTLVGICVERSFDMVIGLLGVLKAGCAYVPMDPSYPAERLVHLLADSNLETVISQSKLLEVIPFESQSVICLDDEAVIRDLDLCLSKNIDRKTNGLSENNLAYVIYTSGSTGKPKGSLLEHSALCNLALAQREAFNVTAGSRVIQFASFAFDAATSEVFMALSAGAALHLVAQSVIQSSDQLSTFVVNNKITHATLPPALLPVLDVTAWSSVQDLIVAGDNCPLGLAKTWSEGRRFYNAYGPSETTVCATIGQIFETDELVHMGKPMAGVQVYILDDFFQPAPVSGSGQLYVGGRGVGRGYLNQPKLSAEKFIANPFFDASNPNSSERLYKTGDLVRYLPDGNLEFLGRIDHQVKIRGFRIELGEIEQQLLSRSDVNEAVVVALSNDKGDKRLVAYVTHDEANAMLSEGDESQALRSTFIDSLRQHLSQGLPDYMVPSAFVVLEHLPLTPNGKIDRKGLPAPDMSSQQKIYVAPTTDTEKHLCEIWQEVLGLAQVGITDNFFELGGHSLLATRLVANINTRLGIDSPLKLLFSNPTIATLASALSDLAPGQGRPDITLVSREQDLQPSFAQQRLWLLDKIDGGSAHYNMPGALRLTGDLDVSALTQAMNTVIERHESLRTYFAEDSSGQPLQVIQNASPLEIPLSDISLLPVGEREFDLAEIVTAEARKPFDLSADLMLRAQLVKVENHAHVLLVTMHHIASDGWSMTILINEFSALYQAYVQGKNNPLPELAIQYADYAQWQRDWLQGEVLDAQLGYWKTQLAALPVVHSLPLDKARPKIQTFNGASHHSVVSLSNSDKLNTLCQGVGGTLFMGLHAAFSVLLSRYSNETDIVMGSPIANREQAEVASLIGFFVNTLVLRCDLSGNPSFTELLKQSQATLLDAYAHQQVPFEQIVEVLQPERSMAHSPLFQVMLALQNNEGGTLELPGLTLSQVAQSGDIAKYDLTLNIVETPQGLQLSWEYNTDLFNQNTITRLAKHFELLLTGLVNTPDENVFAIDMLSKEETHQQLVEWNDTQADFPKDTCIHELFEQQVNANPDAIAVVFEETQLTYGELNAKANQLAHYLIEERQVTPDILVGICVERSLEMIVGIMGILKAGGAYVPLDPSYPAARLAYMLEDANLTTVLTQAELKGETSVSDDQAIFIDSESMLAKLASYSTSNPSIQTLTSRHLAYVIYTSGSTGNPKGVEISHDAVINFLQVFHERLGVGNNDRWLAITPISFDISGLELYLPLLTNSRVILVSSQVASDGHKLAQLANDSGATIMQATPATWSMLWQLDRLPNLRHALVGGDVFPLPLAREVRLKVERLWHVYGPTETTIWSTISELPKEINRMVIGKPINNTSVYVLSESHDLFPVGVPGELLIGGVGLARGYLNRPDLTSEKFIQNPFSNDPNDRVYKTGDLVRYLPDGNLEFLGRIDQQVKIRGFRVELGEIEQQLLSHSDVNDAVVVALSDDEGDKRLVAYVTHDEANAMLSEGDESQVLRSTFIDSLREQLSQGLPDYMVPSAFVVLENLPLTPNGKIDRKGLPAPDMSSQQKAYVAPTTDTEKLLCEIWQEVLGLAQVGITDNFFELGGHSLLATRLVANMNEKIEISLDLKNIFVMHDVISLAAYIDVISPNKITLVSDESREEFEL